MKLTRTFKQSEIITQEVELTEEQVARVLDETGINLLMEDKLYASDLEDAWSVIEEIESEEGNLIQMPGYYGNADFTIENLQYSCGLYIVDVINMS